MRLSAAVLSKGSFYRNQTWCKDPHHFLLLRSVDHVIRNAERNAEVEGAALSLGRCYSDGPAVQSDDLLAKSQPQA